MTNNMDEFDHEDLEAAEGASHSEAGQQGSGESWRSKPLVKLLVIMAVVGTAIAGALGAFSGSKEVAPSNLVNVPGLNEAPGGKSSPYFNEQNKQANAQRADQAMQEGGSALPTPSGQSVDIGDLTDKKKEDPLTAFRAETERLKQELKQEQQQNTQQIQVLQQQVQQRPPEAEDNSLAQAMQRQMQQLMESWTPHELKVVDGVGLKDAQTEKATTKTTGSPTDAAELSRLVAAEDNKAIVQAGTVNYAQLLTEANSDVPGPILAQILSGPLSGGRAIGRFQVNQDLLVLEFSLVNYKGKDYAIHALALDPDTTLGGLATEVDHRYFDRVLLPAAGAFVQAFGQAVGQPPTTTTVSDGAVVVSQAGTGIKNALAMGLGQAGQTMNQFFTQEGNRIQPLVRVAVGTPMGLFFLSTVKENSNTGNAATSAQAGIPGYPGSMAEGVGIPGYANGLGMGQQGQVSNPYGTMGMGSTYNTPNTSYGNTGTMGYNAGRQQYPTGVNIMTPGQTGYGTGYYGR